MADAAHRFAQVDPLSVGQEALIAGLQSSGDLMLKKLGTEWLEATPERVVARIPVEGNTQPFGLLHGGASATLAEALASVGAWLNSPGKITMGIEIKVNHIRGAREGWVTGVGTPLFSGRSVSVWEVRLTDDDGKLTAFSTATIAIRDPS
jgi:uncharacterized protein (TIGR00369 family)